LMAYSYYYRSEYNNAINCYKKSLNIIYDPNICLQIAQTYDEKLNSPSNAIIYYQRFIDEPKTAAYSNAPALIETVQKRLAWLKKNLK
jgi:hypothetical protein